MLANIVLICPLAPGTSADVRFGMGMDRLLPVAIFLILRLGAMTALIKAGLMSWRHSLQERMEL